MHFKTTMQFIPNDKNHITFEQKFIWNLVYCNLDLWFIQVFEISCWLNIRFGFSTWAILILIWIFWFLTNLVQLINSLCNKSRKLSRFGLNWNIGKNNLPYHWAANLKITKLIITLFSQLLIYRVLIFWRDKNDEEYLRSLA